MFVVVLVVVFVAVSCCCWCCSCSSSCSCSCSPSPFFCFFFGGFLSHFWDLSPFFWLTYHLFGSLLANIHWNLFCWNALGTFRSKQGERDVLPNLGAYLPGMLAFLFCLVSFSFHFSAFLPNFGGLLLLLLAGNFVFVCFFNSFLLACLVGCRCHAWDRFPLR